MFTHFWKMNNSVVIKFKLTRVTRNCRLFFHHFMILCNFLLTWLKVAQNFRIQKNSFHKTLFSKYFNQWRTFLLTHQNYPISFPSILKFHFIQIHHEHYPSTDDSWLNFPQIGGLDFLCCLSYLMTKTPNRLPLRFPSSLYFSRGFKFLFYAAQFYCCYTYHWKNLWISLGEVEWMKEFPSLLNVYEERMRCGRGMKFFAIVDETTSDNSSEMKDEWWFYECRWFKCRFN